MVTWARKMIPMSQKCYSIVIRQCSTANVAKEMKEILRIAATGDLQGALSRHKTFRETNDVPDWGVVKLSSIALANGFERESESLLKQHYEETGGQHRFARKSVIQEEQIVAALLRVLNNTTNDDSLGSARRLYQWLLEGRFCSNKDVYIVLFIDRVLQRSGIAAGLAELEQLKRWGRVKSLTRTFHCLLWNAVDHGKAEELAQVESVISSTSPTGLQRLKGFVLLELGKKGAFLDSLGQEPHLEHSRLLFMVEFAAKLKTVIVLESLLELSLVLQIRPQEKALIYDELIKIYGKHEDKDNLERITEFVLHESDRQPFTATLGRLAHFYRCCQLDPPSRLLRAL